MIDLTSLGWSSFFSQQTLTAPPGAFPARVIAHHRSGYRVLAEGGERWAECSGRLRHGAGIRDPLPAVGDWVSVEPHLHGDRGTIHAVYGRHTSLVRKAAGDDAFPQVLAANLDLVLIVVGLDLDPNLRRLERTLAAAWESGATPLVLLNKTDLSPDPTADLAEVEACAAGVEVLPLSALTGAGVDEIRRRLGRGKTAALLGASGVGKSTLSNALLGVELQDTGPLRASDGRGRHTTTGRHLLCLPDDLGCLIDTPGLRELGLWEGDGGGVALAFPEIEALAQTCRFKDCTHDPEPGCAIQAGLETGELDPERFESYLKLRKELAWVRRKANRDIHAAEKRRWKLVTKGMRQRRQIEGW